MIIHTHCSAISGWNLANTLVWKMSKSFDKILRIWESEHIPSTLVRDSNQSVNRSYRRPVNNFKQYKYINSTLRMNLKSGKDGISMEVQSGSIASDHWDVQQSTIKISFLRKGTSETALVKSSKIFLHDSTWTVILTHQPPWKDTADRSSSLTVELILLE